MDSTESRDHLEVSPESAVVVKTLSNRIAEDGGVALIADYGHDGEKGDTFRVNIDQNTPYGESNQDSKCFLVWTSFEYMQQMFY